MAHEVLHADGRDPAEDDESESEPVVALVVGAPFTSTAVVGRRLAHQFRIRKQATGLFPAPYSARAHPATSNRTACAARLFRGAVDGLF